MEMANSIKVINVNNATLTMFTAKNSDEFISSISKTFGNNALDIFSKQLLAIWNEEDIFRMESDFITFDGKYLCGIVSFCIPKVKEDFKSVPVSILDITEIKKKDRVFL